MEFHGYDFTAFNPLIVSDAKRMVEADETLARDWNTKVDRSAKIDKMIEQMCDLYDDFFCTVLGDDYNACIDVDTENLDEMAHLYVEFCNTSNSFTVDRIQDAAGNLHKVKPTDKQEAPAAIPLPMNRAERRAARRESHRKPDRT